MAPRDAAPVGRALGVSATTTPASPPCAGTLAALVERGRTGKGRVVESSLLRTGVWAIGHQIVTQRHFGRLESAKPREIAPDAAGQLLRGRRRGVVLADRRGGRPPLPRPARRHRPARARPRRALRRRQAAPQEQRQALIAVLDEAFAPAASTTGRSASTPTTSGGRRPRRWPRSSRIPRCTRSGAFVRDRPTPAATRPARSTRPSRSGATPLPHTGRLPRIGEHTDEVLAEFGLEP